MRVVAGTLGGRRLSAVAGRATRPTADRVREALFSRLESRYGMVGIDVLDLFAGTGALGIEALSRGASQVLSVEHDRRAARVLIANVQALGIDGRVEIVVADVGVALGTLAAEGRRFDGVFVDPPYRQGLAARTLEMLGSGSLIAGRGWVSLETGREDPLPDRAGRLVCVREDVYGDTRMTLYEMEAGKE